MLGASKNRLLNSPVGERETKSAEYRKVLYNKETGESEVFTSMEECVDAEDSGVWVDTPAKTNKGEWEKLPKDCEFYVNRKCSKGCGENKPVEKKEDLVCSDIPDTEELVDTGERWVEPVETVELINAVEPKPIIEPNQIKIKKFLSQMSHPELVEEGKLYNLDFSDGKSTKSKMKKDINKAKGN